MSGQDLEALAGPRIREAVRAAIEKVGRKDFLALSGLDIEQLSRALESDGEYLRVTLVTLACQINKSHGDQDPNHSSVSECLKGTVVRLPLKETASSQEQKPGQPTTDGQLPSRRPSSPMYDQKTVRLLNFGASLITFLILGYFLGGMALAPLLGLPPCVGVSFSASALSPCLGSGLGLIVGAIVSLAYTYYYFVNKM